MDDNRTGTYSYTSKDEEEHAPQEGRKGGESWFTTWYEFESDKKDNDEDEYR